MIQSNKLTWWTKTFLSVKYHIIAMYLSLQFKLQNVKNVFSVNCVEHIVNFDYASQNAIEPFVP
jgi:hypothetical protein